MAVCMSLAHAASRRALNISIHEQQRSKDVTGETAPIAAHMDAAQFTFGHGGVWKVGVLGGLIYGGEG